MVLLPSQCSLFGNVVRFPLIIRLQIQTTKDTSSLQEITVHWKLLNHADPRLNDSEEKNWSEAKILRRTTTGQLSILVHFPAFHDQNFKNGFNLIK